MIYELCPGCLHINPTGSPWCEGCGISLRHGDTVPAPLPVAPRAQPAGVLWLDDLAETPPPPPPPPRKPAVPITLRNLDTSVRAGEATALAPTLPLVDELVLTDPPSAPPAPPAPPDSHASRAARRAVVRRKRLARTAQFLASVDAVPEVLVVDPDEAARGALRELLVAFGFGVLAVGSAAEAEQPLASRRFEAVFADIALDAADGGAGIELCHSVRGNGRRLGGEATLLVLVTRPLRPVERVRAELAGCDEIVAKPARRGDVARVLDTHGVPLPADARRG